MDLRALPLDRFCNAVWAWVRQQMSNDEEGQEKWTAWTRWVFGEPAAPTDTGPSRAEQITAAARAQVGDTGAAFAAFAGTGG